MTSFDARLDRRRFLAAIGITAGTALAVAAAPTAKAGTISRLRNSSLYRSGLFRRRAVWTTKDATLVVLRRKAIRSNDGTMLFDRNAFEVIFAQGRGDEIGSGTTTLTNQAGTQVPLFLVQTGPKRYSAIINRQSTPGSTS